MEPVREGRSFHAVAGEHDGQGTPYDTLDNPTAARDFDAAETSLNPDVAGDDQYGPQRKITSSTAYLQTLQKEKGPFNWRNAAIVGALFVSGAFSKGLAQYAYGVFVKPLEAEFDWQRFQTNGALTIGQIASAFLAPITGWVLDKRGGRSATCMCLTAMGIGYLILSFATNIWFLYAAYCFAFFCYIGIVRMIPGKLIPIMYPENKGVVLAIAAAGSETGGLIITPSVSFLIDAFDWRRTAQFLAGAVIVLMLACAFIMTDFKKKKAPPVDDENDQLVVSPVAEGNKARRNPTPTVDGADKGMSLKQALMWPGFYFVGISIIGLQFHITMVASQLVPHFENEGVPSTTAATMVSVAAATGIIAKFAFGKISDMSTGFKAHLGVAVVEICGLLALLFAGGSDWAWAAAAMYGFSQGVGVTRVIFLTEAVGLVSFGRLFSFILTTDLLLASGPGPVIAGLLFEASGNYNSTFFVVMGFVVLAVISMFISRLFKKPEVDEKFERVKALDVSEVESVISHPVAN